MVIEPAQQRLKVLVYRQGFRFVNGFEPRAALDNPNRPATTMSVPGITLYAGERIGIRWQSEFGANGKPIRTPALKKFEAAVEPTLEGYDHQAPKDRILAEELQADLRLFDAFDKALKSFLAG